MGQQVYTIELHRADPDEGEGFWVSVPALPGCFTQGKTYDEAVSRAQEAIQCHLEALAKSKQAGLTEEQFRELLQPGSGALPLIFIR